MAKRLTQREYLDRCEKTHGNRYDYSLVEYTNMRSKVKIICKIHGIFEQRAKAHSEGQGCLKCSGKYKITTSEFIEKAKKIHGNRYDYSLTEYKDTRTRIKIIDKEYNTIREQFPQHHLNGHLCNEYTTELFIKRSKEIHGNKYDYSLVDYIDMNTLVKIIDKEYDFIFEQQPCHHLRGYGSSGSVTRNYFIKKCEKIHNNRYDYSLVDDIKSNKDIVQVICKEHGIFEQSVSNHMNLEQNCPKCSHGLPYTTESFVERCREVHGDEYDYTLVEYSGIDNKIKIICREHGVFEQSASKHINAEQGCPDCSTKSKGENKIARILTDNEVMYVREHTYNACRNKNQLPFDFYIPSKNMVIEYDGIQHFESIEFFGGKKGLETRQKLDKIKDMYCKKNNIYLIRIPYTQYDNIKEILLKNNVI